MPREFSRTQRVGEQIQRELAVILQREMKDPRLGLVTVSGVDVSRDLQYARIHVTFLGKDTEDEVKTALEVLRGAAGFIRSLLAKQMRMRSIPNLTFHYDKSLLHGRELSSLIDKAVAKDRGTAPDAADEAGSDAESDSAPKTDPGQ